MGATDLREEDPDILDLCHLLSRTPGTLPRMGSGYGIPMRGRAEPPQLSCARPRSSHESSPGQEALCLVYALPTQPGQNDHPSMHSHQNLAGASIVPCPG